MTETTSDLAALIHEHGVRRLAASYCDAVNHHDHDRASSVYALDGRLVALGATAIVGRDAIREALRQTFSAYSYLHQICHAGLIDVTGDRAIARWSVFEINRQVDQDNLSLFFGSYEDELVRLPEGWRFSSRKLTATARARTDTLQLKIFARESGSIDFSI